MFKILVTISTYRVFKMDNVRPILVLVLLLSTLMASGQLSDLAKLDFTRLPKGNSEVGYSRGRALFNYPITLNKDAFLLVGLDYSKIELSFSGDITDFDRDAIEDFQMLDINIGYTFKWNDTWRFGVRISPGYSSNLVKEISLEDVVFSGAIIFIKDGTKNFGQGKPDRLILGVSYAENRGVSFPLPFVAYYRKFHPKWSYNLGVPKSNLQYHFSSRSRVKLIAELDGFTANIQGGLLVNGGSLAHKANMSIIVAGLRYEYKLMTNLEIYVNASGIISSGSQLRDARNRSLVSVNVNNVYYFRLGTRLKI